MRSIDKIMQDADDAIKWNREHFETRCECIKTNRINKFPQVLPDIQAVRYYENECECGANYT